MRKVRRKKSSAKSAVRILESYRCEYCERDFSANPSLPRDYSVGGGPQTGVLYHRLHCPCECGGIELEADDGTIRALYHAEGCSAQACHARAYETWRARELAAYVELLEREAWEYGL